MGLAPSEQPKMMNTPPPSYEETMPAAASVSIPINGHLEFGPEPLQLSCRSCFRQVSLYLLPFRWPLYMIFSDCDWCQKWDLLLWLGLRHPLLPVWLLAGLLPCELSARVQEIHPHLSSLQINHWSCWAKTFRSRNRNHHFGRPPRHRLHCRLCLFQSLFWPKINILFT